ncbi:carbohydrate-binding domain-containing protein [Azospirillum rugosum]|uniref:Nitrous oxidase accessory protein NosD n=1 Tax=Azospirillum rugosum TaxID=416170 RepID=A0ABS4SP39_9PROT|nr:carbohydrate-binding domain-containing protein [Azospirillum rugosum]MBP2294324.1 nitrous oxidase accessory protein NosD [Azospirillum rugosum]MDQ0527659.1 nitrous oxidase accessory protein NosD [Azospirillum rugosum]
MMAASTDKILTLPIVVNAWGVSAGQAPHFKLLVDDMVVGEAWVAATTSAAYSFQVAVNPDEGHRITVWYDNDNANRDLFVGSILVGGQEIKATDPRVTYDKGAYDGKDVVRGQEGLYWGGALSFGLGEEVFGGPMVKPPPAPEPVITRTVPITVRAALSPSTAGTAARFKVLVDGVLVGEGEATGTTPKPFTFAATLDPSVAHTVQVLPADGTAANALAVTGLSVNGRSLAATPAADGSITRTVAAPVFQGTASQAEAPPEAPSGNAYYVAKNGKDSWSGRLAEPNADGTDGPFASLERAQAAMRGSTVKTTYVREGTYQLSQTLELTSADSGVRILGYPGEQVVISGGRTVGGFISEGNGVWSAALAAAPGFDVTVDGVRYTLASKAAYDPGDPTTGWYVADAATAGASGRSLRYHAGDVTAADLVPGLRIQVFDTERLQDAILTVAGIDTTTRTITFTSDAPFSLRDGSTFRLLGNAAHVDQAGEFAYRAADGRLVIDVGAGANFDGTGVSVARLGTLLRLNGAAGVTVQGLTFTDTTTDGYALDVVGGGVNRIVGNSFVNVGTGIHVTQASDRNLISGNYLDHLGISGVLLDGQSDGNTVTGNRIQHIGEVRSYAGGIMGAGINDTVISYNDIDHSSRYGISIKNWNAATVSLNNSILYNRVRNTGEKTADSGAIELLGRSGLITNTLIKGNRIEHAGGIATTSTGAWLRDYKGFGVYLDDMTSGVTVQDNFLKDTSWASVMIHGGHDNTVTNNIGVLGSNSESFLRIEWVTSGSSPVIPANNTITRNIIEGVVPLGSYVTLLSAGANAIDYNFVHRVTAYGAHDLTGDPLFADPYDNDYSLLAPSPALTAGIHDLAWMLMGMPPGSTPVPDPSGGGSALPPAVPEATVPPAPIPVPESPPTPSAPVPDPAPVSAPPLTAPARPSVQLSRIENGVAGEATAYAYDGPIASLTWSFLGNDRNEVVRGSGDSDFLNLLGGDDAADGAAGDDVLDGGAGSNFLTGGAGKDTFFVDARGGQTTWSTVTDLETGEWATLWGYRPGTSRLTWEEMGGTAGFKGATVHVDIDGNGSVDASMTFTGKAVGAMTVTAGTSGADSYLAFISL